jgi:hypothetical protein
MHLSAMSTQEIIAELPRLSSAELALVRSKLDEALKDRSPPDGDSFFATCLLAAKSAPATPPDFSENIDAYLYGGNPQRDA